MSIYLDHAATTHVLPEVKEAMAPYWSEKFGNPSSIHQYGRVVRAAVEHARNQLASELNTNPHQVIFTSGGTESDNLALLGTALAQKEQGKDHIITTQIEHPAVLDTCKYLERLGFQLTYLPVDSYGKVDIEQVQRAIQPETALISIMYGNNEVGTIQPIQQIGELANDSGILFHTDAVQAFGLEKLDVNDLFVDLLSLSGHKIGGPKGIGALYLSEKVKLIPQAFGGNQERRQRSGTENVPGIVGFGKAVEYISSMRETHRTKMKHLRDLFLKTCTQKKLPFVLNGHRHEGLPHICNLSFPEVDSETMLINLDMEGIACSSGSACTSGTWKESHVLKAMQLSDQVIRSAIRFSFGYMTTEEEILKTVEILERLIHRMGKN